MVNAHQKREVYFVRCLCLSLSLRLWRQPPYDMYPILFRAVDGFPGADSVGSNSVGRPYSVGSANTVGGANRCSSARSVGRAGAPAHVKCTDRTVRVRVDQSSYWSLVGQRGLAWKPCTVHLVLTNDTIVSTVKIQCILSNRNISIVQTVCDYLQTTAEWE